MKITSLVYQGHRISFLATEDVAEYISQMDENFLDDEEEGAFFKVLFPDQWEFIRKQVINQVALHRTYKHVFLEKG